jgi:hypothetical protein
LIRQIATMNGCSRARVLLFAATVVASLGLPAAVAVTPAPSVAAAPGSVIVLAQTDVAAEAAATDDLVAVIATGSAEHRFTIEVADTPDERARGLMFRETMAPDAGMLFDYGSDQRGVAFWMKNTPLPLDMIFIREDGTITQIAADTTPYSLEPIASREPVRFVLEVNAGTAARLGITPGGRLVHPRVVAP